MILSIVRQSLRGNVFLICAVYLGHSHGLDASTGLTTATGPNREGKD
jgi:hypothetical protein